MKHRISGCPVNLASLTDDQLDRLVEGNLTSTARMAYERQLLVAEQDRRVLSSHVSRELEPAR